MNPPTASELDLPLVRRVEAHAVSAWPPAVQERTPHGWVLRATPGLRRGRSNHALTPCRELSAGELEDGIARTRAFAHRHGIRPGIQVSPAGLHGQALETLGRHGWAQRTPVVVLGVDVSRVAGSVRSPDLPLRVERSASPAWLETWARCDPGCDVGAHACSVFPRLEGQASFVRWGAGAVGVAVPGDGLVGLFCLAVAPEWRRRGIGTALVRSMLGPRVLSSDAEHDAGPVELAYLQVEESNHGAIALYERLGFRPLYRYVHCVAPAAVAS